MDRTELVSAISTRCWTVALVRNADEDIRMLITWWPGTTFSANGAALRHLYELRRRVVQLGYEPESAWIR